MLITAFAALKAGENLSQYEFSFTGLKLNEVLIKVHRCALSHSDVHMIDNDWFCSSYPLVPGHEIAGTVEAVGEQVTSLAVGDRVGLGWHNSYCQSCEFCLNDEQHLCTVAVRTMVDCHGGFASHVVGHETAVVKLPDGLGFDAAAPLMSAGIAVFDPLLAFDILPSAKVAIIGSGGLGHLAIQFYRAWGCEVTVFTRDVSQSQHEKLAALGAKRVVSSKDDGVILDHLNSFDFILSTVNQSLDWASFIACLKPKGRLHFVGLPLEHLEIGIFPLVSKQRCISGSQSGAPSVIAAMLKYALEHNICPVVTSYTHLNINAAIADLRAGNVDGRAVIQLEHCVSVDRKMCGEGS